MGQSHFSFQLVDIKRDEDFSAVSRSIFRAEHDFVKIAERSCRNNSGKGEINRGMRFARLFVIVYCLKNRHKHAVRPLTKTLK